MTELASVKTEPEVERLDTITIRACANGWIVLMPGSEINDHVVFTSLLDLKCWLSDNLVDNT